MSQFGGGGKPGAWGRPTGGAQLPNFGGIGGVGSFPMMGMSVPMINQAAFSQTGMMGMGVMGAVPQQQQRTAAAAAASSAAALNTSNAAGKNRTFVGVVTKMHDSYGFVDDDVFFQHSVIRGSQPRVGDKVMVEASYNPQMPFKWNAYRIQHLSGSSTNEAHSGTQARVASPMTNPPRNNQQSSSRWGSNAMSDRNGSRSSPPRRRSPPRRSPRRSPPRNMGGPPKRRSRSPQRRSPPPVRRASPPRDRKRPSAAPSSRRDTPSPPRRRARIIPRYECRVNKPVLTSEQISLVQVKSRYSKLYIPSDFVDLTPDWVKRVPLDSPIDFTNSVSFHVLHKDVDYIPVDNEKEAPLEPEDFDHRHQVKVLLMSHNGKQEIMKKAFGLLADGSLDDSHEVTSLLKQIQFLVGVRGKEFMAIGGSYSPSLDGPDPANPGTLIKTAIRTTKALTGVDLSGVPQWYSLVQVRYYRADKDRVDRVHLLWPDTQLLMPPEETWNAQTAALRLQCEQKLTAIEEMSLKEEKDNQQPQVQQQASTVKEISTPTKDASKDEPMETPLSVAESDVEMSSTEKPKPAASHWNDLDVKTMKVAELKAELDARGLENRGIKNVLAQRLQEALDKEQELEEDGPPEEPMEIKEEPKEEVVEVKVEEIPKTEEELKKEAEEIAKKAEKLEKEKKEKKAAVEKHYNIPKEQKIFVFPSKTAKNGKFDCRVVSLHSLLEYRNDDNKESQFEVSLFAEAFKELLERLAAFKIYQSVVNAADRDAEKKRKDEAKGLGEKEKSENAEEDKDKKEEEKPEKIELKSVVSDRSLFEACVAYDGNLCGYIGDRDLEEIFMNCEFGLTRGQISKLVHRICSRERFNYRDLTDNLVDTDGNVRFTPGQVEQPTSTETLLRGYGLAYIESEKALDGSTENVANGQMVVINGNVINVEQKLALLKKSEQERDQARAAFNEQTSLLSQLREAKQDLEKKKKDLERDLDKTKKKLSETGSTLKASLDDTAHFKTALADVKRYAERVLSVVDKACPPTPKKEDKEKKTEEKDKSKESKEKQEKPEEPTIPAEVLVLSDEAGPEAGEAAVDEKSRDNFQPTKDEPVVL
ncbi:unnamed protein product [Auanema sp. JU1783]|nr:unnamed protein product [Auanema sp. JU1783]